MWIVIIIKLIAQQPGVAFENTPQLKSLPGYIPLIPHTFYNKYYIVCTYG